MDQSKAQALLKKLLEVDGKYLDPQFKGSITEYQNI